MDVAAWNTLLDCVYGPARAAGAPAAFEVALLATSDLSSELTSTTDVDGTPTANGYVRGALDNDAWLAAAEAVKTTSAAVGFGTPTAPWPATVRYWALIDTATSVAWNILPLTEPLTVTGPGGLVTVTLSIAAGGTGD